MSPADEWQRHWIVCLVCEHGETPAEDIFCDTGKRLRRAAIDDMYERDPLTREIPRALRTAQ